MRSKKDNIFETLFNIASKDKLIRHDKMTSFQNLLIMAGVLLKFRET